MGGYRPSIARARDEITRLFLTQSQAPVLVMADTDMHFSWEHVAELVALTAKRAWSAPGIAA